MVSNVFEFYSGLDSGFQWFLNLRGASLWEVIEPSGFLSSKKPGFC